MRYLLELAYNGTGYCGWQRQPNALGVQQVLEEALETLLRQPVGLVGSGRTDTGVHARQQFAHFDWPGPDLLPQAETLLFRLNKMLPPGIAVMGLRGVSPDFHARFTATARRYEYHLSRRKDPFRAHESYFFSLPLDLAAMNTAAALLLQHRDFESFSRVKTQVHTFRCHIREAHWEQRGPLWVFHIEADRFLRGMVRAIAGTLLEVGQNRMSVAEFEAVILACDRRRAGRAVPPQGLFLTAVRYPPFPG